MEASDWSCVPQGIVWRVLDASTKDASWKTAAQQFHLVNKHWRDAIRQWFTVVNPLPSRAFSFEREVETLSHFPNLHTLILKTPQNDERSSSAQQPVDKLLRFPKMENLAVCDPCVLESVLDTFCEVPSLKWLYVKHGCLRQHALDKCFPKLMSLRKLKLECVDVESFGRFVESFKSFQDLEVVDLPFVNDLSVVTKNYRRSLSAFEHLSKLKLLRFSTGNFSLKHITTLFKLTMLTALVLDGRIDGDRLDLSLFPQLVHLSVCSIKMPVWVQTMPHLQSLALDILDRLKSMKRQEALLAVAPKLTSFRVILDSVPQPFVSQVLSRTTHLEKLKTTGAFLRPSDIQHCQKLKEIKINASMKSRRLGFRLLTKMGQLPDLKSLSLNMRRVLYSDMFNFLLEENCMAPQTLTKLVIHNITDSGLQIIVDHLGQLRDLRIHGEGYSIKPFLGMLRSGLALLKNLCVTEVSVRPPIVYAHKTLYVDMLEDFLKLDFLMHLEHLALPTKHYKRGQIALKNRAPRLLVDNDPNWEPEEFYAPF